MRTLKSTSARITAALPVAALLLLAGCKGKDDAQAPAPDASAPASPNPPGPSAMSGPSTPGMNPSGTPGTAPGGPGGTMNNKPSMNPAGAAGDALITAKVKSALIADTKVGATSINVDTKSGTVVLRGKVKTAEAKTEAITVAKKMQGVHNVIDQLAIAP